MRKVLLGLVITTGLVTVLAVGSLAFAGDNPTNPGNKQSFKSEVLNGYQETPGVSSVGFGEFEAELVDETTLVYTLTYAGIEGGAVTQAHIHFGNRYNAGGVSVFLCPKAGAVPPTCPPVAGTVTGVITPADVIGPTNQGIEPGAFEELIRAMRAGETYANVHSTRFPAGEIRAQIADMNQRQPG